ncbi:unnamed protein product [Didymodactylos carnosus]|uniref:Homeobox protein cut-like n=1 Tax=Didymodactylos carnosus TaxID=1234261 RepID=A0A813TGQ2_9BILA|nr:unnamed protein product [Didymodactylos carnosus]CAF1241042.1 unnamed protein product [Didymodactylos carnosus]CAF3595069.1 unnamed protein product [Didymodactylos carnosus]CAF4048588.1 unnamed protein product [Didymodactylos carnosus]
MLSQDVSSSSLTTTPFSSVSFSKLRCPSPVCSSPTLIEQQAIAATLTKKIINDIEQNKTVTRTVIKSKSISEIPTTTAITTTTISTPKQSIIPLPQTVNNGVTTITPTAANNNNNLEPLDTGFVASAVRKLLAQHNIGQRIFARYILSLSQGTVSELLSKPKTWQKLTEKGKESYRKMWCWANSEESILTLKSISPRKGTMNRSKDNIYHTTIKEERGTEQKIVQTLTDAQKQISKDHCLFPQERTTSITSTHELALHTDHNKCHSSSSTSSLDDNIIDKTSQQPPSLLTSKTFFSPLLLNRVKNEPSINENNQCSSSSIPSLLAQQQQQQKLTMCNDNYRNWLMLNEIVRNTDLLNQLNGMKNDEKKMDDEMNDENEDEEIPADRKGIEQPLDLSMKFSTMDDKLDALSSASSSTNDLNSDDLSTNQSLITSKLSLNSIKPVKSILPPIREYDTMKYRYINTNELVQTIKDILSRYSISQRHFGEKILGLSQGSVSDILARPKQWELLTQKGREPFLRMKLFLDDKQAVEQLIQNIPATLTTTTPTVTVTNTNAIKAITNPSLLRTAVNISNGHHPSLTRTNSTDSQPCSVKSETVTTVDTINGNDNSNLSVMKQNRYQGNRYHSSRTKPSRITNNRKHSLSHNNLSTPVLAPYELPKVPIPTVIDTEQLSSQVRELLFAYSIGQRVFGEAVLNLSQGTVSEILSKPRPWHSLSVKGREPYMRMYTWYNDIGNVHKLLAWKRERDVLRRNYPEGDYEGSRPKRRCLFTEEQRRILKQIFEKEPYPSQQTLEQVVNELNLPMNKIANWFHNSRMRAKTSRRSSTTATDVIDGGCGSESNTDGLVTNSIDDTSRSSSKDNNHQHEDDDNQLQQDNSDESDDESDLENETDEYPMPTFVPVTSTWLNGSNDADGSCPTPKIDHIRFNPRRYQYLTLNHDNPTIATTNIVSLISDIKTSSLPTTSTSSSKKRKSIPQKIIVKKFDNTSITNENEEDSNIRRTLDKKKESFINNDTENCMKKTCTDINTQEQQPSIYQVSINDSSGEQQGSENESGSNHDESSIVDVVS